MKQWKGVRQTEVKLHCFFIRHIKYTAIDIKKIITLNR
jgi:hypothetical protein